jgi:hypothetical protein
LRQGRRGVPVGGRARLGQQRQRRPAARAISWCCQIEGSRQRNPLRLQPAQLATAPLLTPQGWPRLARAARSAAGWPTAPAAAPRPRPSPVPPLTVSRKPARLAPPAGLPPPLRLLPPKLLALPARETRSATPPDDAHMAAVAANAAATPNPMSVGAMERAGPGTKRQGAGARRMAWQGGCQNTVVGMTAWIRGHGAWAPQRGAACIACADRCMSPCRMQARRYRATPCTAEWHDA